MILGWLLSCDPFQLLLLNHSSEFLHSDLGKRTAERHVALWMPFCLLLTEGIGGCLPCSCCTRATQLSREVRMPVLREFGCESLGDFVMQLPNFLTGI